MDVTTLIVVLAVGAVLLLGLTVSFGRRRSGGRGGDAQGGCGGCGGGG